MSFNIPQYYVNVIKKCKKNDVDRMKVITLMDKMAQNRLTYI